ncbi:MAG TPA: LSM domain-containing protein [Geobacterales bacterium]|nr:LSM domain-containing protein [Geobacterales bacterium]
MVARPTTVEQLTPLKLMFRCVNDVITVYLKDNTQYRGVLISADQNMNLILDDAEEINSNGETKIKYGKILVRGNNILYISVPPTVLI